MRSTNRSEQALLGFLSWGPMSGYDLRKAIAGSISNFWAESYGQIYPILKRLEASGLATSEATRTEGGRARVVYAITDAGRTQLERWLSEPVELRPLRNELLLKLFFGARCAPGTLSKAVAGFREKSSGELGRYAEIRERLERLDSPPADLAYWIATLHYGELEARAHVEWADATLATLNALPQPEAPRGRKRSRRAR